MATCGLFILTVFLMVAAAFNPQAVGWRRFFDRHGMLDLGVEVGTILVAGRYCDVCRAAGIAATIDERERLVGRRGRASVPRPQADVRTSEIRRHRIDLPMNPMARSKPRSKNCARRFAGTTGFISSRPSRRSPTSSSTS